MKVFNLNDDKQTNIVIMAAVDVPTQVLSHLNNFDMYCECSDDFEIVRKNNDFVGILNTEITKIRILSINDTLAILKENDLI